MCIQCVHVLASTSIHQHPTASNSASNSFQQHIVQHSTYIQHPTANSASYLANFSLHCASFVHLSQNCPSGQQAPLVPLVPGIMDPAQQNMAAPDSHWTGLDSGTGYSSDGSY
ncbi:unnamed protein product [Ambrosiozyma monospora]|uniref:Unnamed protein product n=1 Tax=Ambrosiozyma monospora TaxID=43982 RepID=A0A9W6YRR4_AMBMO|nr:unnamed protein product [Ambrosiozyma monospora]